MTSRSDRYRHEATGYQNALEDIAGKLREEGTEGVREWLVNNLRRAEVRSMVENLPTNDNLPVFGL